MATVKRPITWDNNTKSQVTLSGGNLTATANTSTTTHGVTATANGDIILGVGGKWYWEYTLNVLGAGSNSGSFGVINSDIDTSSVQVGTVANSIGLEISSTDARTRKEGATVTTGFTRPSQGDIISVAYDHGSGQAWFAVNGTWIEGNPATGAGASITGFAPTESVAPAWSNSVDLNEITVNFGATAFAYTLPTGFKAVRDVTKPGNFKLHEFDSAQGSLSVADRRFTANASGGFAHAVRSTTPIPTSGKVYWEVKLDTVNVASGVYIGAASPYIDITAASAIWGTDTDDSWHYRASGEAKANNGTTQTGLSTAASGDVLGFAFDVDSGKVWVLKNGVSLQGDPALGTSPLITGVGSKQTYVGISVGANDVATANFNAGDFAFAPPVGFASMSQVNAASAVTMRMSVTATGHLQIRGNGAPVQRLAVEARGTVVDKSEIFIDFSIAATGRLPQRASGTVRLSLQLAATGKVARVHATGGATLKRPVITATASFANPSIANLTLPSLTASGEIVSGIGGALDVELPLLEVEAYASNNTDVVLPLPELEASLLTGELGTSAFDLPVLSSEGVLVSARAGTADLTLGVLSLTATALSGNVAAASNVLPFPVVDGVQLAGTTGVAALILPFPSTLSSTTQSALGTFDVNLPFLILEARMFNGAAPIAVWSLNLDNGEHTKYTNYTFHSFGRLDGAELGAKADGIYLLTGSDDQGTAIAASAKFGFADFGSDFLKRLATAYVGHKGGDITLDVATDDSVTVRQYLITRTSAASEVKRSRVKLARGLRARYWQLGVSNVAGSDFELESISPLLEVLRRKA